MENGAPHPRRKGNPATSRITPRALRQRRALLFWLAMGCFGVTAIIIALLREMRIL